MKFMRTNIRKRSGTVRKNTASGKSPQAARKGLLVRSHVPLYLFALCFLAGMVLGVVMSLRTGEETLQRFDFLFHTSAAIRLEEPVSSIFAASFASSFLFLLVCFLFGLSVWGFLFVPAVVFFRGYGVGLTAGFLCAAYQWKGAFYHLMVILPGAFLTGLALLFAAREAVQASKSLRAGNMDFKRYVVRCGVILSLAFGAAILDVVTSACFSGFFSFA